MDEILYLVYDGPFLVGYCTSWEVDRLEFSGYDCVLWGKFWA